MYFISHYTLLPEKEIKSLKIEYRIRILVVLLFFISCAMIIGICSLLPSYILSYAQEKNSVQKVQSINESLDKDHDIFSADLLGSYKIIKKIKLEQNNIIFSNYLKKIDSYKNDFIVFNSFQLSKSQETSSSTSEMILQGKAKTRNSILQFKKVLESNSEILKVELPLSDLTKNKDIDFAFRIKFK